jgi:hypothetical protein
MGYVLLWIENVATVVLLIAWLTAATARWRSRGARVVVPVLAALIILGGASVLVTGTGFLHSHGVVRGGLFWYGLTWAVALALGSALVFWRGWSAGPDGPAARTWPRGWLGLALGVALALHVITISNMDLAMKVQLAALRAEAGAKIITLTPPPPAERDNAAPVYHEAFAALTPAGSMPPVWQARGPAWLDLGTPLDAKDAELDKLLQREERGLALVRRAAALPACSFERDWLQSSDLVLPELDKMRHAADLLTVKARWHAARGEAGPALDNVAAILGMARHINDPILVSLLFSARCHRQGIAALEEVLLLTRPSPKELARFKLPEAAFGGQAQRTIQMEEAAIGLLVILSVTAPTDGVGSRWFESEFDRAGLWILDSPLYRIFFLADDLAAYRRYMRWMQELARRPYAEARGEWEQLKGALRSERGGGILSGLILPAADRVVVAAARADAAQRLAQVALAAESYRHKHGKLPAAPEQLVPDFLPRLPADPFAAAPLRWRRDGAELVLYSVGPDGDDDHGAVRKDEDPDGDIAFRLRGQD